MKLIKEEDRVKFHYTGKLEDGTIFETSKNSDPIEFVVGRGQIIKGLDKGIEGMSLGETKIIELQPLEGFGERDEALVKEVPKDIFAPGLELREGMEIILPSKSRENIKAYILEVRDSSVIMDVNHPLAGKTLFFEITIVEIS